MVRKNSNEGNNTFVKVTNQDIFNELKELRNELQEINKVNCVDHSKIIGRQDKTNGKLRLHEKLLFFFGGLIITIMGWIFIK